MVRYLVLYEWVNNEEKVSLIRQSFRKVNFLMLILRSIEYTQNYPHWPLPTYTLDSNFRLNLISMISI